MSQLGMGVMIGWLGGNKETVNTLGRAKGQKIVKLALDKENDHIHFEMADGFKFVMYDDGQSCCEYRYTTTDDNLDAFIGATIEKFELREAPEVVTDSGDVHEVQFLVVLTDKGNITFETHNENNGYYGGFWVVAVPEGN